MANTGIANNSILTTEILRVTHWFLSQTKGNWDEGLFKQVKATPAHLSRHLTTSPLTWSLSKSPGAI